MHLSQNVSPASFSEPNWKGSCPGRQMHVEFKWHCSYISSVMWSEPFIYPGSARRPTYQHIALANLVPGALFAPRIRFDDLFVHDKPGLTLMQCFGSKGPVSRVWALCPGRTIAAATQKASQVFLHLSFRITNRTFSLIFPSSNQLSEQQSVSVAVSWL